MKFNLSGTKLIILFCSATLILSGVYVLSTFQNGANVREQTKNKIVSTDKVVRVIKEKNKLEDINLALEDYSIKRKNPAFNNKILYASTTDSNPLVKRHDFKGKIDKRATDWDDNTSHYLSKSVLFLIFLGVSLILGSLIYLVKKREI